MNKNWFYIILYSLLSLASLPILAQQDSLTVAIDSSKITTHNFSENLTDKYSDSEFDYDTVEGETQNFLARFINWIFKGMQNMLGVDISPELISLIENLIYILLIIGAVYVVIRILAGKDAVSLFRKKNTLVAPISITEEHIENIDLNELISKALANNDYRLAVRYMYLKALQELSKANVIAYHFEKTNSDYLREINDTSIKQNFNRVSYLYDYIWYGEFELDKNGYQSAKTSFDQLNAKINTIG
ncbi:DUF4129 domain-containing protein [Aquimarina pacifica]|uniref:DUF4129 domain-containing protein n=1 Tax=Aquimarina pacifica TaxID=1296415 RepID=UPI00054FCCE9|nr:DUF4129 domain-containing protein [Aquimarina pacifica]